MADEEIVEEEQAEEELEDGDAEGDLDSLMSEVEAKESVEDSGVTGDLSSLVSESSEEKGQDLDSMLSSAQQAAYDHHPAIGQKRHHHRRRAKVFDGVLACVHAGNVGVAHVLEWDGTELVVYDADHRALRRPLSFCCMRQQEADSTVTECACVVDVERYRCC